MIEIMEWSQLLNALEQSQLVRNVNNLIFIGYLVLFLFNRKVVYFTAFFMCVILIESGVMQQIEEYEVYLLIAILYSYVFVTCKALKNKYPVNTGTVDWLTRPVRRDRVTLRRSGK